MPPLRLRQACRTLVALCLLAPACLARQAAAPPSSHVNAPPAGQEADAATEAEEFALSLFNARSEAEMRALLAARPELITSKLWDALDVQAQRMGLRREHEQVLKVYRVMETVGGLTDDQTAIARALLLKADNETDAGRALKQYQESFRLSEAVGDKEGMGVAACALAQFYFRQGNPAQGFESMRRGLALLLQSGNKRLEARTWSDAGAIHYLRGEYDQAADYFRRSLTLSDEVGDKYLMAIARFHLGAVHRMRGDYERALELYLQSQSLLEEFGDNGSLSSTLRHIATTYYMQGNYRLAEGYQERSLRMDEALKDAQGIAYSLLYGGMIQSARGRYARALESLEKSLRLFESLPVADGAARSLGALGSVYHALGQDERSLHYLSRSLELRERLEAKDGIASTLLNIGIVHDSRGDHPKALEYAGRAAELARRIGSRQTLWSACTIMGKSYRALGRRGQAREAFDEAVATVEAMRAHVAGGEEERELFFEDKVYAYRQIIETLVEEEKGDEAFTYAERARAQVLLDVLRQGRADVTGKMSDTDRERERKLKGTLNALGAQLAHEQSRARADAARLAALQNSLERARLDYADFQMGLYAADPTLKVRRGETVAVTRPELIELLPDRRTALVEYAVTDERTFLFVFKRHGDGLAAGVDLKIHSLDIKRGDLSARVENFRRLLASRNVLFTDAARSLYDLLLRPAREQLRGVERLVVVPDEALWELPFQALQPAPGRYVVEDCAVSYAPSLTVLREMARERQGRQQKSARLQTLLAFGNPALGPATVKHARASLSDEPFAALPEAEKLVRTLVRLYGARRSRVYTGAEAREGRFKAEAGRYRVVHLATHGVLDDASPMYSHAVMAREAGDGRDGAPREDGLLEAWELMRLNLGGDLVVLSACETARGGVRPGEGIVGLTWALFVAGSPTAVVSQWKVDSASTTQLMLNFHRQLLSQEQPTARQKASRGVVTKAEALRAAALQLLGSEQYAHPFYWAGFVLVGDGS